ncbi:hypothetical protein AALO_G00229910 [Alosa alosa]|uniref:Uncharacterized protein n=1 Tax=Alosa alosa TaxID=278164 RepID=A0AAV6FU36_9TELE|nr:hypothetical protein AALO_G00229910 [Alosa alosa]
MKTAGVDDAGLFTESYCNICNAQLISESQRIAHYESKKHANKVRLFYMLHPEDGGPPSKRLRPDNPSKKHANKVRLFYMLHPEDGGPPSKRLRPDNPDSAETEVDRNKCCTLCNMFFTSAVVAQSHYQGKTHAKRLRLVLGDTPPVPAHTDLAPPPSQTSPDAPILAPPLPADWLSVGVGVSRGVVREAAKYCCLCGAWFNNPLMAQQHYEGKKHRRNATRVQLLQQLADSLGNTQTAGLRSSYSCSVCKVIVKLH